MKRILRRGAVAGALLGLAYAVWRTIDARRSELTIDFEPQPFPAPPRPVPRPEGVHAGAGAGVDGGVPAAFVLPDDDGRCPVSHPIKAKMSTGIFHPPGAFAYERTHPDRCYRDAPAAEADGLRAAKR